MGHLQDIDTAALDPFRQEDGTPDLDAVARQGTGPLYAVARRLMKGEADAEDVVQDAFVSAVRAADRFEGRALTTSWMYRITYNAGLMQLRTRRRKGAESLDALGPEVAERGLEVLKADDGDSPDRALQRRRLSAVLQDVLGELSDLDRTIVTGRLLEGWSTEQVAEATGLTPTAAKSRLHRARKAMQELLEAKGMTPAALGI